MTAPRAAALSVGLVGAGIGGLTAAISLRSVGVDVTVYEKADELSEVGAGIQMSPNATRVLHGLGLLDAVDAYAVRPATGDLRRWEDWSLLTSQPLGEAVENQFGMPYLHLHRADLLRVLASAVPDSSIRTGHNCIGLESMGDDVRLVFDDRSGRRHEASHDVVIGADGIHSHIRSELFGPESPTFSGSAAWRGVVPASDVAHLDIPVSSTAVLGPDAHLVHYYLRRAELVNWVGITPSDTWTDESWTARGRLDDALADFADWAPTIRSLVAAVGDTPIFRWALYDRDPLPGWVDGRVALLGDACHPMLPYMAQGAAQSIEDAAVLARCLSEIDDPAHALARYEVLRRDRTAQVQTKARENGVMFHLPDGPEQQARDAALAAPSATGATHRNAWLFDYDIEALILD